MSSLNTTTQYGNATVLMHWLSALLIGAVYSCIELRELYPQGSDPREALKTWHFMLGLSLFLVSVPRVALAFRQQTPLIKPTPPEWQDRIAKLVRRLFYVLLLLMPLLGWSILSLEGKTIPFFFIELPPLWAPNETWAHRVEEIHETIGKAGLLLILLHTVAALFHHYRLKDNTLSRIWPKR
jgi:cytochrome b561